MIRLPLAGWVSLLAFVASAAACAPDPSAPVKMMALVPTESRTFEPAQVELGTLTDVTRLEGTTIRLLGDARILLDPEDPQFNTNDGDLSDEQLRRILVKDEGGEPNASYVEVDGVLWPADFDTWNMVTTYFNFERSLDYFVQMGGPREALSGATVYYFPSFTLKTASPKPLRDNALFFSPIDAFAVLPFDKLQDIPLGMNLGVIGHEFSHRVFNQLVFGGAALPPPLIQWSFITGGTPQLNLLSALDEGLADYHAHGATCLFPSGCDTRFIEGSVPGAEADRRDLANPGRCMSHNLKTAMGTLDINAFKEQGLEYFVGTLLSTSLWQAGNKSGKREALQRYIVQAYNNPSGSTPGLSQHLMGNLTTPENVTLNSVVDVLVSHVSDLDLRTQVCNELLDRLSLNPSDVPSCPLSSQNGTLCPDIQ